MDQYDLCSFIYDILLDLVVILLHLRFLVFFMTLFVILFCYFSWYNYELMLDWNKAWMNDDKCMQMTEWMYERRIENLGKREVSASSGFLQKLGVS